MLIDFTKTAADNVYSLLQGIEAATNLTLLTGTGAFFLIRAEARLKRRRALSALHELRSIVHVIDMHQLTKDPSKFVVGGNTPSSPPLLLDTFQMTRYLDYCSEMVSLTSKIAVLFAQSLPDRAVTEAVSDISALARAYRKRSGRRSSSCRSSEQGPARQSPMAPGSLNLEPHSNDDVLQVAAIALPPIRPANRSAPQRREGIAIGTVS